MKLRLPWQKERVAEATTAEPGVCAHPRAEVDMHGTAIKRRWCALCGADLPVPDRGAVD